MRLVGIVAGEEEEDSISLELGTSLSLTCIFARCRGLSPLA